MSLQTLKNRDGKNIIYLTPDEVHGILSFLQGRYRLLAEVLWNTGIRIGEALELTTEAINFEAKTITVRNLMKKRILPKEGKDLKNEIMGLDLAVKRAPDSEMLKEKLEQARVELSKIKQEPYIIKYRLIPILATLADRIAEHCVNERIRKGGNIFQFSKASAGLKIREASERAEIEKGKGHPSAFRHGFAVNATLAGMPPAVLRGLMGHTNIVSTLVYTNILEQDARKYLEKMKF